MTKLLLKITHFLNRKNGMKVLAVILIVGVFFFHHAYAAGEDGILKNTQSWLNNGLGVLSWIWIFLAIIAGKLMTNDIVYGAFMHLDKYLWDIWNIMKNFANFGLAALILYSIVKYVMGDKEKGPKGIIIKALVAGVLIQMSRFMVGALVDLSAVATSAVAAFPANFIGDDQMITNVQGGITKMLTAPQYVFKMEDGKIKPQAAEARSDNKSCLTDDTDVLDAIMPKYNSVSGPLIFIGMSFFKVQNYMNHGVLTDDASGGGQLIINLALKMLILLAYTLCLAGLVIANLVRVLFLWILIMVSPIAVLMGVFDKKMEGADGITKYFTIPTFLNLIFKPVFFIGFLGITLILISSMQQIMGGDKGIKDMKGINIIVNTGASTIEMNDIASFQINGDVFGDVAESSKTAFVDLLLIVMTLLLLWQMLKWSIEFGGGPVKDVFEKLTPLVEEFAGHIPIIPAGGGMGLTNIKEASKQSTEKLLRGSGMDKEGKFFRDEEKFKNLINEKFLGIRAGWSSDDSHDLEDIIKSGGDFWSAYVETGKRTSNGVSITDGYQSPLIDKWFLRNKEQAQGGDIFTRFGIEPVSTDKTFDDYFKRVAPNHPDAIKKLHALLGGDDALTNKITPHTYEEIKNNKYHYNPKSRP